MSATDNLYILDVENEKHSIKVLEFFLENILNINKMCKRYIRIYQLSPSLLETREIQDALSKRNVSKLPSLVVFSPRSEVLVGVDEIILFYQTLLTNVQKIQQITYQKRLKAAQESKADEYGNQPSLLDDTQSLMNNFYDNEIMSKSQERSVSSDIGSKMSERYRDQLSQRGQGQAGRPKSDSLGDDDPLDFNKALQARRRGSSSTQPVPEASGDGGGGGGGKVTDDAMESVRKVTKDNGADGEIEYAFFQNLLESSDKL